MRSQSVTSRWGRLAVRRCANGSPPGVSAEAIGEVEAMVEDQVARQRRIEACIFSLRGQHVLLDADLATLYGVETRAIVQAVKRNLSRFPEDFMFQLSADEYAILRSQFVISRWGGRRHLPYAFTEQGVAMLSSVLNSPQAIQVNIQIMRSFVRLRRLLGSNEELARKLSALERKYDVQFRVVFDAIRELMALPAPRRAKRIGFSSGQEKA